MNVRVAIMHVDVRHKGLLRLIAAGDTLVDVTFLDIERNWHERAKRNTLSGTNQTLKYVDAKFVQSHELPFR